MDEMMQVLAKRRMRDLNSHMAQSEVHAPELSSDLAEHLDGNANESNARKAAMTQPPDEVPMHDPMKETGEGYFTEREPKEFEAENPPKHLEGDGKQAQTHEEEEKEDEGEGAPHDIAHYLGSENAHGLRGKAMQAHMKGMKK